MGISEGEAQAHAAFVHVGERRFIYAARRDGAPGLVVLPDGEAKSRRATTKLELMCPVAGCSTPGLTSVSRSESRDGYRHLAKGVNHGAERMHHVLGKGLLARWARWTMPGAVAIEEHPSNVERERIADVMVTLPDGGVFALEVQYAGLSVEAWRERHESYRRQGIVDIWLFGHAGEQSRWRDGVMHLNATQREIASSGTPVLWLNPLTEEVAFATTTTWSSGRVTILAQDEGVLRVSPLREWKLLEGGMFTRELIGIRNATVAYLASQREEAARRAAVEAARRKRRDDMAAARSANHEAWLVSAERAAAMSELGEWPAWLTGDDPDGVRISGDRWRWFLWSSVIRPLPTGKPILSDDLVAALVQEYGDACSTTHTAETGGPVRAAVLAMLHAMQPVSVVSKHRQKRHGKKLFWFTRGSVRQPLTPAQRADASARAAAYEATLIDRVRLARDQSPGVDYRRGPGTVSRSWAPALSRRDPPAPPSPKSGEMPCVRCGFLIAAFLVQQGLQAHPTCSR